MIPEPLNKPVKWELRCNLLIRSEIKDLKKDIKALKQSLDKV